MAALLRQSLLLLDFVRTYRDAVASEEDEKGKDPDSPLRQRCQVSLEALDGIAEARREQMKRVVEDEHRREYQRQEEMAAQVRQTFVEWHESLNRPFPSLDLMKLEEEAAPTWKRNG